MAAFYDDQGFDYPQYWLGRQYEHQSEVVALKRLLARKHFTTAADLGGGYGRLAPTLAQFADRILLVEPAAKQRATAKKYLAVYPQITITTGTVDQTGLAEASVELVTLVRVAHHLPNLAPAFREIRRILKPAGLLVVEFANAAHFKRLLTGRPPAQQLRARTIPFVNHYPSHVLHQLAKAGLTPTRTLSVSNWRLPVLKKWLPLRLLIDLESLAQPLLARLYFGPSIWVLARRLDKPS